MTSSRSPSPALGGRRRPVQFNLALTTTERLQLRELADATGRTDSAYLRHCAGIADDDIPARPALPPRDIAERRRRLGLRQRDVAQRVGVPAEHICRLERWLTTGGLLDAVLAALADDATDDGTDGAGSKR